FAAAPDGQPVGGVRSAAPGYHYTRDHLLPLEPAGPPPGTNRRGQAPSPSCPGRTTPRAQPTQGGQAGTTPPPPPLSPPRRRGHNTATTTGTVSLARKDSRMIGSLSLAAALALGPAQAGGLSITNIRTTYGELGAVRTDTKYLPGDLFFVAFDVEGLTLSPDG